MSFPPHLFHNRKVVIALFCLICLLAKQNWTNFLISGVFFFPFHIVFPSDMSEPIVKKYSDGTGNPGEIPRDIVPMGRMGDEKEMGGTLLYLASRAGAYTNGDVIVLDGGRLGTFPSVN